MPKLRVVLAFHFHQPPGQLEKVFEQTYKASYRPLLDLLEKRRLPATLHTSGPLLEWLLERHPESIARLQGLIAGGQVEILGGGLFEPVMAMIPHRDRVGQIRAFTEFIEEIFSTRVRGLWLAEGAWEQRLVIALASCGIEYTLLDEFHFERSPSQVIGPFGYYLTECEGYLLKAFAASPALANGISFAEPSLVRDFLDRLALKQPGSTIVFPVDATPHGTRAGGLPGNDLIDWIERFYDLAASGGDWLEFTTLARVADCSLPLGKVALSDSAHRFRNDQSRRAEGAEMYARMLGISQRLAAAESNARSDPDYLEIARLELFRAQCGSAYSWHDGAGGLALPFLRNEVYRHLIAADDALDETEGRTGPRVRIDAGDFNLDARQEVRLENDFLIAFVRPAFGGHVYELDVRDGLTNVLATLDRLPEAGHAETDRPPRKALVDHFYPVEATLQELLERRDIECGDFAVGTFQARVQRQSRRVSVIMERAGRGGDCWIRVRKTISLGSGEAILRVHYVIEQIPADACLHFGVEINVAALSGDVTGGSLSSASGARLGPGARALDLPHENGFFLTDRSSGFSVSLNWSQAAGLWCFPIETLVDGEEGCERLHQSCAVIPHWHVTPDETGTWSVSLEWTFDPAASAAAIRRGNELSRAS